MKVLHCKEDNLKNFNPTNIFAVALIIETKAIKPNASFTRGCHD